MIHCIKCANKHVCEDRVPMGDLTYCEHYVQEGD